MGKRAAHGEQFAKMREKKKKPPVDVKGSQVHRQKPYNIQRNADHPREAPKNSGNGHKY